MSNEVVESTTEPDGALADFTTQAAFAGSVGELWDTPEEDEAWHDLGKEQKVVAE